MSHDEQEPQLTLEAPDSTDPSASSSLDLSPFEEGLAATNARLVIAESLMKLMPREMRFNDFAREILLICMKVVKSEAGSLLEVNHTDNNLFFRATVGQSSDTVSQFTVPMGQGIVGHVAESRTPLVVGNADESRIHLRAIAQAVGFEARNLVAVPILIRGRIYGVLELLNRIGEEGFTPADLELLNYFCDMAAKAFEIRFLIAWGAQSPGSGNQGSATPSSSTSSSSTTSGEPRLEENAA